MAASLRVAYFLMPLMLHTATGKTNDYGTGKRCYSCTSYMSQCKAVVEDSDDDVFKASCTGKCFVRMGEDGAMYRGCFDGFVEVGQLSHGYDGCRNQTWNGRTLPWCLCDDDLCNGGSMNMRELYDIDAFAAPDDAGYDAGYDDSSRYYDSDVYAYNELEPRYGRDGDGRSPPPPPPPSGYDYEPAAYAANPDGAYMGQYARRSSAAGELYDEALFGSDDVVAPSTDAIRTPFPREYKPSGFEHMEDYASARIGGRYFYYPQPKFQQERYYPFQPPYSRESDARHAYNENSYNDVYPHNRLKTNEIAPKLASKIRCSKSGYYQNPNDCRQFIACLMDPYSQAPVMHLMKCPQGLLWDNDKKICMQHSGTCSSDSVDVSGYNTNAIDDSAFYGRSPAPGKKTSDDKADTKRQTYSDVEHIVF